MRHKIMKKTKTEILADAKKHYGKIGTKQIIGHVRLVPHGKQAVNIYKLEDDTEVIEDDNNNVIAKPDLEPIKRVDKNV